MCPLKEMNMCKNCHGLEYGAVVGLEEVPVRLRYGVLGEGGHKSGKARRHELPENPCLPLIHQADID